MFVLTPVGETQGKNDPMLELAKTILKEHKKKAKDEKRKHKKHHFTILETTGILFMLSWPLYYGQKIAEAYLTYEINHITQQLLNVPH